MRKIGGILGSVVILLSVGLSVVHAQESLTYKTVQDLADTPSKYGFKGLYTLFNPATAQKGKFGFGLYWDMTRFCLPGDPRYPELMEFALVGYYGITDKLELGFSAPMRKLSIPAASAENRTTPELDPALSEVSESGFSNVALGLRYNLLSSGSFDVTPYILAFLPTAQDPEKGLGADNTRIHFGVSAGTVLENLRNTRLYTQVAYQFATSYDQDRRNFTERHPFDPAYDKPRFDYFGTNPLFHEYGNTLFYGAGLAIPIIDNPEALSADLFGEFQFYHSFEKEDYIPMFEDKTHANDYQPLDVVQDGGAANVGLKIGFGNGVALTAGWGTKLFAKEPMYESPIWKAFAGLTYNMPEKIIITPPVIPPVPGVNEGVELKPQDRRIEEEGEEVLVDCWDELAKVGNILFEFDKSTLTPEAIGQLKRVGVILRACDKMVVEVQGHTDWIGTENYNMGLGNRRARAVVYYLAFDEGIDPARIVLKEKMQRTPQLIAGETYGETKPIASNETDAGRAQNRRSQFAGRMSWLE